jgi:hypothetical protein
MRREETRRAGTDKYVCMSDPVIRVCMYVWRPLEGREEVNKERVNSGKK